MWPVPLRQRPQPDTHWARDHQGYSIAIGCPRVPACRQGLPIPAPVADGRRTCHPERVTEPTDYYSIRFGADPVQLVFFRHGFDRWLAGLGWPEPERVDAVLAIGEACGNAVEPGDVEVTGRVVIGPTDRHLVVQVRDHGRWRRAGKENGYGLTTVRACMQRVRIRHDEHGTVVTMTSRPVPLVPAPRRSAEHVDDPSAAEVPHRLRSL
jgi:anti-sigma regulatory factor (Ser/Thr protein kinase)